MPSIGSVRNGRPLNANVVVNVSRRVVFVRLRLGRRGGCGDGDGSGVVVVVMIVMVV